MFCASICPSFFKSWPLKVLNGKEFLYLFLKMNHYFLCSFKVLDLYWQHDYLSFFDTRLNPYYFSWNHSLKSFCFFLCFCSSHKHFLIIFSFLSLKQFFESSSSRYNSLILYFSSHTSLPSMKKHFHHFLFLSLFFFFDYLQALHLSLIINSLLDESPSILKGKMTFDCFFSFEFLIDDKVLFHLCWYD